MDNLVIGGAVIGVACILIGSLGVKRRHPRTDGYGSARFSSLPEIKSSGLWCRDGVVVGYAGGRHLRCPRQTHVLMVGPSGTGKSEMMSKTAASYRDSLIMLEPKGTMIERTTKIRQRMGQRVDVFDPVHGGAHIDPFSLIGWGRETEVADIQRVVEYLTYTEAETRSDAGLYYLAEAQEALWATTAYLHYSQPDEASPGDLRKFFVASGAEIRTRLRAMIGFGHPTIHEWASQVMGKSNDLLDKIWTAARRWLMAWVDPSLSWNTHDTTIDLNAFQQEKKPATLYLKISVEDLQGRLRSFTRMLLDLLSLRLCDRREKDYRHDVLWVLDDMTELRYLPMIERLTTYLRGYGHLLLGGTQSFAQIWQWFGRFSGVLNNTTAWVLFRPNHYDEAKVIAENLGQMTVMESVGRMTRSMRGGSYSVGMQSHARWLMTPDQLMYDLGDDEVVVKVGGYRPMRVSRGPLGRVA